MNASNGGKNKQHISNFLVSAISDVAENVKFTETKVGITFALYSLIAYALAEVRGNIFGAIKIMSDYGLCCILVYVILMLIALGFMAISMFFLLKTVTPGRYNFDAAKDMTEEQKQMWIVRLKEGKNALNVTHEDYYRNIMKQDEDSIIKCESYELLRRNHYRPIVSANNI
jgi:Zn-dependent membrane protease YugP